MKKIQARALLGMILFLWGLRAHAQALPREERADFPGSLSVTVGKTTHLVFPQPIASVDRGSRDILVQPAPGTGNILRVKAARPGFGETNLTVITTDGGLYSFTVTYATRPPVLLLRLGTIAPDGTKALLAGADPASLQADAAHVLGLAAGRPCLTTRRGGVQLQLTGVYLREGVMYYRLRLENRSGIGYESGALRFSLRDRKRQARTASQELELVPLDAPPVPALVAAGAGQDFVVALSKRTLPRGKYLAIELLEENGARHLLLKVPGRLLLQAAPLPGR